MITINEMLLYAPFVIMLCVAYLITNQYMYECNKIKLKNKTTKNMFLMVRTLWVGYPPPLRLGGSYSFIFCQYHEEKQTS